MKIKTRKTNHRYEIFMIFWIVTDEMITDH